MSRKSLSLILVLVVSASAVVWMGASAPSKPYASAPSYVLPGPADLEPAMRSVTGSDVAPAIVPAAAVEVARVLSASGAEYRRHTIGVVAEMPDAVLDWVETPSASGPSSWTAAVRSEGAVFVRPHFAVSPRTLGYEVYVYGPEQTEAAPLVDRRANPSEPGLWGPIAWGETAYIEVVADRAPVDLRIDRVGVGEVDFRVPQKVQNCHLDPTCYPEYADEQSAIALLVFGSGFSQWLCTGNMLADTAQTGQPWLLTANHCMNNQSDAESLVAFFRYQTSACNGSVPNLESTPATAGADFKAGNAASDYGLALLQQDPPAGTVALGWTTEPLASNEDITVIHQPAGSWKRIAFGFQDGDWGNKWNVGYTEAVTESGSSGSALLNDDKLVVGQLSTGTSYCWFPQGTDQYGKFSLDYSQGASNFLDNGPPPTTTTTTIPPDDDSDDDDDDDDDWHDDDEADDDATDDDAADDDFGADDDDDDDDDDNGGCGC